MLCWIGDEGFVFEIEGVCDFVDEVFDVVFECIVGVGRVFGCVVGD